jgi:hypothetical protein
VGLDRIMALFHEVGGCGLAHFRSLVILSLSCPRRRASSNRKRL